MVQLITIIFRVLVFIWFCYNGFEWSTVLKKRIYLTVGLDTTLPLSQLSSGWMLFINKMIWKAGEWDLCAQGKCSEQKLRSILEKEISPFKKKFCTISNMIKKNLSNVVLSVWFIFMFWIIRAYQWNWNCSFFPHQESQPSRNNGPKMCFYLMLMLYYICYHRPICFNHFMIHYSLPVHLCA